MINPTDLYNKALAAGEEWADKDHAAGVLEDALDALKGQISAELKAKGESISLIRDLTRKDERWREASIRWRDARKQALIAKLKYEQVCRYQDNLRTNQVTERQLAR